MRWFGAALLFCGWLIGLGVAPAVAAADGEMPFHYRIDLQVPAGQRKFLEEHLDLYRWRDHERMDEMQLRRLVRLAPEQIRTFLATEGFYSPKVDATLEQRDGAWWVKLIVVPAEPVRVRSVDLRVIGPFDDNSAENQARLKKMRDEWRLPPGQVFRHDTWEEAKRGALKALLLKRYPAAAIQDSRATVDPDTKAATLELTVDSGPAFTFGDLQVRGLERYPASSVARLNPIKPGDPYSQEKLLDLQSRLQDSAYFANAAVSVAADRDHPLDVPVSVEVTENPSRKLGFGLGVSTDTGLRGQIDYRDLNVLDRAWRVAGTMKLEEKRQSLEGGLQLPLAEKGYRDIVGVEFERTDIQGEVTRKFALGPKRTFVRGRTETSYGLRYVTQIQDVHGLGSTHASTLAPAYSWTLRATDSVLFPTRGYLFNIQVDAAARVLASDQNFLRGYARAMYLRPVGERGQLILRGELGALAAPGRDGIPAEFLFRTGGDQSVRGYSYQSLGLKEGDAVVGGRYLGVISTEYIHWLTTQWGAAAFIDGGNAADALKDVRPAYGYGAGARWKSPVGPLSIDLAYGRDVKQVRIHFSVGFNF